MCDNIQLRARESASNFHRVLQRIWLHVKVYGLCLWQDYDDYDACEFQND